MIVRINFGLEGHLFWMSMEEYTAITTVEPETYGTVGGRHYLVPTAILSEAVQRDVPIYLRPLMALIGETHILVVADHNALLKLTVGSLTRPVQDIDLLPTSDVSEVLSASILADFHTVTDSSIVIYGRQRMALIGFFRVPMLSVVFGSGSRPMPSLRHPYSMRSRTSQWPTELGPGMQVISFTQPSLYRRFRFATSQRALIWPNVCLKHSRLNSTRMILTGVRAPSTCHW